MPIRRTVVFLGLALTALASTTSADEADEKTAIFDISVAGIPAGELTLSHRLADDRYQAGSAMRATGLIGAIARIRFDGAVAGRVEAGGRLEPELYKARHRSTRSERDTEIVFEDGTPVEVSVVPPRSSTPDLANQAGALDPVSAAVELLRDAGPESICNDRVTLFDGSRSSELRVGQPELRDGAVVCHGRYLRLEGEAHSMSDAKEWPFQLIYEPDGAGMMTLRRIETPTRFGLAVMERSG